MKQCTACDEIKQAGEFYGSRSVCKTCVCDELKESRRVRGPRIHEGRCVICGKTFTYSMTRGGSHQHYCSEACKRERNRRSHAEYLASSARARVDNRVGASMNDSLRTRKPGSVWETWAGYTVVDLVVHLEAMFQPGMNWDNYGRDGWNIDHVIPRAAFEYSTPSQEQFRDCWKLENIQPLWAVDNRRKNAKLPDGTDARRVTRAAECCQTTT